MQNNRIIMAFPKANRQLIMHDEEIERLRNIGNLVNEMPEECSEETVLPLMRNAKAVITGWGSAKFTTEMLDAAPELKIIAHSAGTLKHIVTDEIWRRGIVVANAAAANAESVAQFTYAMMIFMLKDLKYFSQHISEGNWGDINRDKEYPVKEPYRITVGIVSASRCGRLFIELLPADDVEILVYDPYLSNDEAAKLGAKKVTLEDLMQRSDVISIHAPSIPETDHIINKGNLGLMKDGAVLLQTSRGSVINEPDLIAELKTGRIRAAIDVTDPEPPAKDNPLRNMPNVVLTPHRAGALGNGCLRMGKMAVDEVERVLSGQPARYPVTEAMLKNMA